MASVKNDQIGREMDYPYEASFPDRQFAFVFNINRCIACQTCTMACKSTWTFGEGQEYMWWNNVETKPYGGYPHHWDAKILSLLEEKNPGGQVWSKDGVFQGKTIFETGVDPQRDQRVLGYLPTDEEWRAPNIFEEVARAEKGRRGPANGARLPEHGTWFFYLQRICNHCQYPACLAACPRQAIYKRKEDGVVLIDQKRCRGYRKCVEACPYKKPMFRTSTGTSEKCIACYPRLEGRDKILSDGVPLETRCMSACVGKIRLQSLVAMEKDGSWKADPDNPVYYMVEEEKVALPLYPQFGTSPNGYYIPPRWVPRPYLDQMFGPGVEEAIERYVLPSRRLMGILALFRASREIIFRVELQEGAKIGESEVTLPSGKKKTHEIFNDTVIGYDTRNRPAVRITIEEPIHVRPSEHYNSI
ncbi:MAG: 4Fe-4S dicluster domain-containing protein [Acidobacteriota bacterium]